LPETHASPESPNLLIVDRHHGYRRLDQFLAAALAPERSRSQVGRMIKAGLITVNGAAVRPSSQIRLGDRIEIASPTFCQPRPVAQLETAPPRAGNIEILFSDEELIAVNKAAGMPVHPSPGHPDSTLADVLLTRFPELAAMAEPDGLMRAGIVHRLDKETSGVMVVARTPLARMALSQQFKDRTVRKTYLAIVHGNVNRDHFVVDRPLGRHPTERKRMSIRSHKPRNACTEFLVLQRFAAGAGQMTLLRARPQSGRTHQIRVHLAACGHPCVGDALYGGKTSPEWMRPGQALHALELTITHPRIGERLEFIAPPPADIERLLVAVSDDSMVRRWIDTA
jgi:23S rRNA pseudouridine1911/1915/1917 synthase